jgi:thioredoxin-like negative regulator of GroEL
MRRPKSRFRKALAGYRTVWPRFRVQSIPNFVVLRDGNVVLQQPGLVGRQQMKRWLESA